MKNKNLPKYALMLAAGIAFASFLYVNTDACMKASCGMENTPIVRSVAAEEEQDRKWSLPETAVLLHLLKFAGKFLPVGQ